MTVADRFLQGIRSMKQLCATFAALKVVQCSSFQFCYEISLWVFGQKKYLRLPQLFKIKILSSVLNILHFIVLLLLLLLFIFLLCTK